MTKLEDWDSFDFFKEEELKKKKKKPVFTEGQLDVPLKIIPAPFTPAPEEIAELIQEEIVIQPEGIKPDIGLLIHIMNVCKIKGRGRKGNELFMVKKIIKHLGIFVWGRREKQKLDITVKEI